MVKLIGSQVRIPCSLRKIFRQMFFSSESALPMCNQTRDVVLKCAFQQVIEVIEARMKLHSDHATVVLKTSNQSPLTLPHSAKKLHGHPLESPDATRFQVHKRDVLRKVSI